MTGTITGTARPTPTRRAAPVPARDCSPRERRGRHAYRRWCLTGSRRGLGPPARTRRRTGLRRPRPPGHGVLRCSPRARPNKHLPFLGLIDLPRRPRRRLLSPRSHPRTRHRPARRPPPHSGRSPGPPHAPYTPTAGLPATPRRPPALPPDRPRPQLPRLRLRYEHLRARAPRAAQARVGDPPARPPGRSRRPGHRSRRPAGGADSALACRRTTPQTAVPAPRSELPLAPVGGVSPPNRRRDSAPSFRVRRG